MGKWQDAHYATAYDGTAMLRFDSEGGTTINDPTKGVGYVFDPRILGLHAALVPTMTVENCVASTKAQAVRMIGKESVGRVEAWHVRVQSKSDETSDFWIDAHRPYRVVKHSRGQRFVVASKFDDANPNDPIPTEVKRLEYKNAIPFWETRMTRRNARFNGPIDPRAWTLAGLGMPVGTAVVDLRIHRRIGYWNGSGLSKEPQPKSSASATRLVSP